MSSTACDELIELIGRKLFKEIITEIKEAKYFSISLDSTPDIANFDKLALTFRYVHKDGPVERFTKFLDMHGRTAKDIVESFFLFHERQSFEHFQLSRSIL